ncbi:MAG: hypothetical protein B7C24_17650 [Bacteroidetes bacterium 4572_77]|nr:MAG: hypothetical protein B7C24_17650 [Bacteroidetes bacterium 4572_77]
MRDYNTPYRNFCYVVFTDCKIGETNTRLSSYKFVLRKGTNVAVPAKLLSAIDTFDANPAHCCANILVNLCGLPISWLDTDSFNVSAITLFDENRGIDVLFTSQQTAIEYISSILVHANAVLTYTSEGTFSFVLIRDDYDPDSLPSIDETTLLDEIDYKRDSWVGTKNEIKVQYTELLGDRDSEMYIPLHTSRLYPLVSTDLEEISINLVSGVFTIGVYSFTEAIDVNTDFLPSGIFDENIIYTTYENYAPEAIDVNTDFLSSGIFNEKVIYTTYENYAPEAIDVNTDFLPSGIFDETVAYIEYENYAPEAIDVNTDFLPSGIFDEV